MRTSKRAFRVESMFHEASAHGDNPDFRQEQRHRELMQELASLKKLIAARPAAADAGETSEAEHVKSIGENMMAEFRRELSEAARLKGELDSIYEAINLTKKEIAALHHTTGTEGEEMTRVSNELDAVVEGTEGATEAILSAAEFIDETANTLSARLKGQDHDLANDIQERVIHIFEACNFQDLTGQRITKVISTLRFIEERILDMMDIWGGIETFSEIEVKMREAADGDAALLNGPSLTSDTDTVSQDDIDALFA